MLHLDCKTFCIIITLSLVILSTKRRRQSPRYFYYTTMRGVKIVCKWRHVAKCHSQLQGTLNACIVWG